MRLIVILSLLVMIVPFPIANSRANSSTNIAEEKFIISVPDITLSEKTKNFLIDNKIKGVLLFSKNIQSKQQIKDLINSLKSEVSQDLLIAVDQEGGSVNRISWESTRNISQKKLGEKSLREIYSITRERGRFLKDLGIDIILGPVADIAYNDGSIMHDRSYGGNAGKVAIITSIAIQAYKHAGLRTAVKHFPGHGNTTVDSHFEFPVINSSLESDLLPFVAAIKAETDFIMLGHIINETISDKPASMEYKYYEILREMGFKGIVMTDDLAMNEELYPIDYGYNLISYNFDKIKRFIDE